MSPDVMSPDAKSSIIDISKEDAEKFSLTSLRFKHRFAESGLFEDDALAELIETYPGHLMTVYTTTQQPDGSYLWRYGSIIGLTGEQVLEAIQHGHLWLNLQHIEDAAPRHAALVQRAFGDIANLNPGLRTFRHNTGILISSPDMSVLYHCDIPPIALWHIRGRKRLWLYPDTDEFLSPENRERVVLREQEEEVPYSPSFDQHAKVFDLEAGDAVAWKQQAPHRVDNLDGLNVSITTSYYTPEAQRFYGVVFANGAMRRLLGVTPTSRNTTGVAAMAKCAFAAGVKYSGLLKSRERVLQTSFQVDPREELGYVELGAPQGA
jgi:hypothetical protein